MCHRLLPNMTVHLEYVYVIPVGIEPITLALIAPQQPLSPCLQSSSTLQGVCRQLPVGVVEEAPDDFLQLISPGPREPLPRSQEGTGCRTNPPAVRVLQEVHALLTPLGVGNKKIHTVEFRNIIFDYISIL